MKVEYDVIKIGSACPAASLSMAINQKIEEGWMLHAVTEKYIYFVAYKADEEKGEN